MKKTFLLLLLIFIVGAASFGTDFNLATGAGIHYQGIYGLKWKDVSTYGTLYNSDIGVHIFLDATYAEFAVLFNYGFFSYEFNNFPSENYSGFSIDLSLLGKYPFPFEKFTLFPLLGISFQFWNIAEEQGILGILGGVGADFPLTELFYIRGELLYGINMWNNAGSKVGHGPRVKVGIGYLLM